MRVARLSLLLVLGAGLAACGVGPDSPDAVDPGVLGKADSADSLAQAEFFAPGTFYFVRIDNWPAHRMTPESLGEKYSAHLSELRIYRADPDSPHHCPDADVGEDDLLHRVPGADFSIRTSGNLTKNTPKSSFKIKFEQKKQRLFGMRKLNLKSMWNDVSQMREALAWRIFNRSGVPAPRHTYARFCINDKYLGLFSIIEQVDKSFLRDRFGKKGSKGNLYKAYWDDIGPATLGYRGDHGSDYFEAEEIDERSYRLKTNENDDDPPELQTYDDLALLIRTINGVGLGDADDRFNSDAYREAVEQIFDVKAFLRWAAVNMLIGAWDNYWRTPANYYLYNSGREGAEDELMAKPYFRWIPWDYDNAFGSDFFGVDWWRADVVLWEEATNGAYGGDTADLPLISNLLKNDQLRAYYLEQLQKTLDAHVNVAWIDEQIGHTGSGGLWDRVRRSAFLESDGPTAAPHTGRQFTNDQVYFNGYKHHQLWSNGGFILGIHHFVAIRHDRATEQIAYWWTQTP